MDDRLSFGPFPPPWWEKVSFRKDREREGIARRGPTEWNGQIYAGFTWAYTGERLNLDALFNIRNREGLR